MWDNQRFFIRPSRGCRIEYGANRKTEQRFGAAALNVATRGVIHYGRILSSSITTRNPYCYGEG
jgi:hypothetical protein